MAGLQYPQTGEYESTIVARWADQLSGKPLLRPSGPPLRGRVGPRVREAAISDAPAPPPVVVQSPDVLVLATEAPGASPLVPPAAAHHHGAFLPAPPSSISAVAFGPPQDHATYSIGRFDDASPPAAGWPHAVPAAATTPEMAPPAQQHHKPEPGAHRFMRMLNSLVPGTGRTVRRAASIKTHRTANPIVSPS